MQYMTNKMLQRFMSHMADDLSWLQSEMELERHYAILEAIKFGASSETTRQNRDKLSTLHSHFSSIQTSVKYFPLRHFVLQQMEKHVTIWIKDQQNVCNLYYEEYVDNRHDTFYVKSIRNRTKQAKKKLAKLVELQQAIRKQKSITKD